MLYVNFGGGHFFCFSLLSVHVRTTYSNAAIILVILRSFSEFEELSIAAYHLLARFVRKRFILEYLKFHSLNHDGFQIYCAIPLKYDVFLSSLVGFRGYFFEIQVVCCLNCQYLQFYHYFRVLDC